MQLKNVSRKGAIEILLSGQFDIEQTDSVEKYCNETIKGSQVKNVGINLADVGYIDSSGLGVLIKVLNTAQNEGKVMFIFGAQPKIQKIFELAKLEKFFHFLSAVEFKAQFPTHDDEEIDKLLDSI